MIYLASIPRCGSTYLLRSIAGLPQGGSTPPGAQEEHDIVKTHATPERLDRIPTEADRCVFLWGDVPAAVESTRRMRMDPNHFANCGAEWPPTEDVRDVDILGYERIWDAWRSPGFAVLWVRYEHLRMQLVRRIIETWVARKVQWLPWRERQTVVEPETKARITAAYDSLIRKTQGEPGLFVRGRRAA